MPGLPSIIVLIRLSTSLQAVSATQTPVGSDVRDRCRIFTRTPASAAAHRERRRPSYPRSADRRTPARGGLTRRTLISSGLLALIIATAFAVLLSSVSDLRASERRARQSEEVLVEANRLERLVIDLETGQRGFIITGEQRFLEPWRDARTALPTEASTLERLVADSPQQEARAQALAQATDSYLRDYSIPLVDGARRDLTSARSVAATSEGGQRINAIRSEFDRFVGSERELAAAREQTSDAAARRAVAAAVAGLAGSILLIVVFAWYLNRAIVGPVRRAARDGRSARER